MIQGNFLRDDSGLLVAFELSGHAGFSEEGEDIVCAAVSALATSAVNGIEALAGFEPLIEVDEETGGYLSCELIPEITGEQLSIAQILLENLLIALQATESEYSSYIHIKTQNI